MLSFARVGGVLLLLAPLAIIPAQGAAVKIAYVNTGDIVSRAPGTAGAQSTLQRDVTAMDAQVKRMSDSLDVLTDAFNKQQATLVGATRDARLKAITDRQAEYQERFEALRQQAQDREAELMQPILDQIKLVLEEVRQEGGYTMIFDVSQGTAIVAADKNLNISDRVIAKLRTMPAPTIAAPAGAPAKASSPPSAPMSAPAGVRAPGSVTPPPAKRQDSTAKADSIARKKVDTTATKPPLAIR
ncbi:MAG: OmpH family outer membrane protein [Gemmatimonadetes bacterium]|nr:OmpH family outer membrane protein [Gemmatimonadota bacterium]